MIHNRWFGPYAACYWALILLNILIPQVLWSPKIRANTTWLFLISLVVLVGMWLERFVIIVTSLHRDYLPSSWGHYTPTRWDWATYMGTIGLFTAAIFIFIRIVPAISIFEMRMLLPQSEVKE
jgi:molybdopterin-containing oxidoreductase family membrane subunit